MAGREAWTDLSAPPRGPRLRGRSQEELRRRPLRRGRAVPARRGRPSALRGRLAVAALTVGVLGACWWVSPTRTAIGLFGAGLFSLVALRRRGRVRSGGLRMGTR